MRDGDRSYGGMCGGDGVDSAAREEIEAMGKSEGDIEGIRGEMCDADVEAEAGCGCNGGGDASWSCF